MRHSDQKPMREYYTEAIPEVFRHMLSVSLHMFWCRVSERILLVLTEDLIAQRRPLARKTPQVDLRDLRDTQ